jgi:hypothetical protein
MKLSRIADDRVHVPELGEEDVGVTELEAVSFPGVLLRRDK